LVLPHLLARYAKGKNMFIDYSHSHVVISIDEYLNIRTKNHGLEARIKN
jgi:hypothetical protein